jgi:hypothetical protein
MATVFGGGKAHTLLALYHIVRHGAEVVTLAPVQELLAGAGLDALPAAQLAAVDCAQISPSQPAVTPQRLTIHTLRGEIAYRLGGPQFYEIVRQSDRDRAHKGLLGAVWGAYTVAVAPSGQAAEKDESGRQEAEQADHSSFATLRGHSLWVRQEHGFPGYRPGEHTLAGRIRKRLMDDQRLPEQLNSD